MMAQGKHSFSLPARCSPAQCQFGELGKRQHGEDAAAAAATTAAATAAAAAARVEDAS